MSEWFFLLSGEAQVALVAAAVALFGTLLSFIATWRSTYTAQKIEKLQAEVSEKTASIDRLEREIHARIDFERAASEWIAEKTGRTPRSAQRELRKKAVSYHGLPMRLTRRDLELKIPGTTFQSATG